MTAGYLTANDQPGVHTRSLYAETAGPIPEHPPLMGDARADVCVIGGGYAGLSAALHLAEAGRDVILIEANRLGWGASGRNGGQLGTGPRAEITEYERRSGPDDAAKVWEIAMAANALVRDLITRHEIDCDLRDGYIEAAWRPAHGPEIMAYAEHVTTRYGHPDCRPIDRDEMRGTIASERYHGGFIDGVAGHLHPLRLALGIGRAASGAGARLHERTRAVRITPGVVTTETGSIQAEHVVMACNGYLDGLSEPVQRRSLPINNFVAATEPLQPDVADSLIRGGACVADSKFVLNYYRVSPDNRLIFGGGESYGRRFPSDIAGLVRSKMLEVFPQLASVPLTHAWGGTLAITGTRFPAFLSLPGKLWSIGGWSGSGIHMGTMGGRIVADAIAGEVAAWEVLARQPVPAFPGGDWFRLPLLRLAMTWYALRDRL